MKKLMAVLLGLSFVLGSATMSFATDGNKPLKRARKAKKMKKPKVNKHQ